MAPLRLISLHLLLASWWMIASFINAADFYDGSSLFFSCSTIFYVIALENAFLRKKIPSIFFFFPFLRERGEREGKRNLFSVEWAELVFHHPAVRCVVGALQLLQKRGIFIFFPPSSSFQERKKKDLSY